MVYENIDFDTERHILKTPDQLLTPGYSDQSLALVSKTIPASLLATCRLINAEVRQFLEPKLALLRDTDRFHLAMDMSLYFSFQECNGSLVPDIMKKVYASSKVPPPNVYILDLNTFERGMPEFDQIDRFVRKCIDAAANPYPRTFSVGLRCPDSLSAPFRKTCMEMENRTARRWLADLGDGRIRMKFREMEELVREGREE